MRNINSPKARVYIRKDAFGESEQAFALANWKDEKFPTLKPKGKKLHDGIIDACLIAEFGRRQYL